MMTVESSLACNALSSAVRRSTYVPTPGELTVVFDWLGLLNHTVPGPLTWLQASANAPGGFGRPSSVAVPFSATANGKFVPVKDWSGPALTTGERLPVLSRPGDAGPGLARQLIGSLP